jgi:catechol 2,3-dioxygenase-like lactoylglutathione lyase family enzyme
MVLQSIDMVAVYVHDWPAALAWYGERLGLRPLFVEEPHNFAVFGLQGGGPVLHVVGDTNRELGNRNRCVPNLRVDDFDATLEELRGRGVKVVDIQNEQEDGYRLATITDPEGNELNLYVSVATDQAQ